MQTIQTADLFCGGGGASLGLRYAAQSLGYHVNGVGINHWPRAIEAYSTAFPKHKVYNSAVEDVDPNDAVPGGYLNLLVAGPSCTHHSRARGGKPREEQHRIGPWAITHWLNTLDVQFALVENVIEMADWRPLTVKGKPDKRYRKGHTFQLWIQSVRDAGYTVDWRVVCAADYGDATSRRRLFIQCVKGDVEITWPAPTHGLNRKHPHRTAREIIDWGLEGKSIFGRKRPLADNTMRRIRIGIERFVHDEGLREAFLLLLRGGGCKGAAGVKSVDTPLGTVTAGGEHHALIEPYLTKYHGGTPAQAMRVHSVDEPLRTIDTANRYGLAEAFAMTIDNSGDKSANTKSLDTPLGTVVTKARHGVVEPHIVEVNHAGCGNRRVKSVDEPLGAVTSKNGRALLDPFITKYYGTGTAVGVDTPLDTVTTKDRFTLVEPMLVHINRNQLAPVGVDQPLRTVTGQSSDFALVETGFLVRNEESGQLYLLDIRFRMLQPAELAAAMSLDGMALPGPRKDQVRLIGNAIPARTAEALAKHLLSAYGTAEERNTPNNLQRTKEENV